MKPPKLKVSDRVRFRAGALLALSFDVDEDEIGHVIEVLPPIDGRQRVTVKFARDKAVGVDAGLFELARPRAF